MTVWTKVSDADRYAVAIYNFSSMDEGLVSRLELEVGDLVAAERENGDWFYGHRVKEPSKRGIYPKKYVCTRTCSIERIGSEISVNVNYPVNSRRRDTPPIIQEITQTLKEWALLWKQLYLVSPEIKTGDAARSFLFGAVKNVENLPPTSGSLRLHIRRCHYQIDSEKFKIIEVSMRTLLELRRELISGNLPEEKMVKSEGAAIYTMDKGNRDLGLDLVVRSPETGAAIDPFHYSTCDLNALHSRNDNKENNRFATVSQPLAATDHRLLVAIKNFVAKMTEDAELLLSLYDGVAHRQLTENYVVRWSKSGMATDIDQMHNLKVIFTDLGNSDLKREKIYLVCVVIRIGGPDSTSENRRTSVSASMLQTGKLLSSLAANTTPGAVRRPFGVAVMEVSKILGGHLELDFNKQYCVPFYPYDKESLESLLKKVIANKDLKCDKTGQGLWICLKLLKGDTQMQEEGKTAIARKMGFPDVIMPGDVRNDLYITLIGGSFSKGGGKSTDRNIEVTVRVCDQNGNTIPGVLSLGGSTDLRNEYTSVVYHHEDRPRWLETFKVCMTIEAFKLAHLLFLFRHRSSNEAKDKSSGHFAIAYIKLLRPDGTTIRDTKHNLALYKVDGKKWPPKESEAASVYLKLPSIRNELPTNEKDCKLQKSFLSLVSKDFFEIESNVCSTKLTQNVELLGVLNWQESAKKGELRTALTRLREAPGDDTVKFLQDLLDALFQILTQVGRERSVDFDEDGYDVLVYECLLDVFNLVYTNMKYEHFQPVLEVYIEKNFCNALVYKKLIDLLIKNSRTPEYIESNNETKKTLNTMKCLECLIRFIVRSRELHAKLTRNSEDYVFHRHLEGLFACMVDMMASDIDLMLTSRGTLMRNLPATVPHLLRVYPAEKLSSVIGEILDALPLNTLKDRRLNTILDLLGGPLFKISACRCILIPHITKTLKILIQTHDESLPSIIWNISSRSLNSSQDRKIDPFPEAPSKAKHLKETSGCGVEMRSKNRSVDKVARLLGASRRKLEEHRGYNELMELSVKTLSKLLTLLFSNEHGAVEEEYRIVAEDLLYTIVRTTITEIDKYNKRCEEEEEKDDPMLRQMVSVLLDFLRQMTNRQYTGYMKHLSNEGEVLIFLTDIQMLLRELVARPVYGRCWSSMINIQNYVILNSIKLFTKTLKEYFLEPFEQQLWLDWFVLTMVFITQKPLQIELMTERQRKTLLSKYKDMRIEAAGLLNNMWYTMGQHRRIFIPCLVGPLLEVSLIPEDQVRKLTIPLFFDMMECEYNSPIDGIDLENGVQNAGNFSVCENELIDKLDELVEGGKGDTEWRSLFVSIVGSRCSEHESMKESGLPFVAIIGRLMDILLQYRDSHSVASIGHKMQVTTRILDFYAEIERPHMYIRYIYKLCAMQEERECWAEAGLVLRLHGALLHWSDAPLATRLRSYRHPEATTHRKLKKALYLDIVNFLRKGKMWEIAIEICKELVTQYENEMFDYYQLSDLYKDMSDLYNDIMTKIRQPPSYFRVAYYGQGFPEFMRNKVYVYRGKEVENLGDFCDRLMDELPNAQLMTKLEPPGEDIKNSPGQYVQINAVTPMISEKQKRLSGKPVSSPILTYYKYNNIKQFFYSRPFQRHDPCESGPQDELATLYVERTELEISDYLPGILCWFPVVHTRTYEMSPLEMAIEDLETSKKNLKALVLEYKAVEDLSLWSLTMKLQGMVAAPVMGGIMRYENIFLNENYFNTHPHDVVHIAKLKDLIADLMPLLEFGIEIHKSRATPDVIPLHQSIVEQFQSIKEHVYANYGRKTCDLMSEVPEVTIRRKEPSTSLSTETRRSNESLATSRNTNSSLKNAYTTIHEKLQRNSLGNNSSIGTQRGSTALSTVPRKRDKERRRNKKAESASQWYYPQSHHQTVSASNSFDASTPVMELRQELTASRPLRSEVEAQKRLSQQRPNSIQSDPNSNRNSLGTTDSNHEDEDSNPPPLPQKSSNKSSYIETGTNPDEIVQAFNPTCESLSDLSEITRILASRQNYDQVTSPRGTMFYSSLHSSRVIKFSNGDVAPTPPPKKRDKTVTPAKS